MKNQTNKKVSKLLIALLSLVIMSVACVAFAACNEECAHTNITDGVDTATCVAGGFITHTCDDCGYTYMTATPAKQHTYGTAEKVPATCTEKGYTSQVCSVCGYESRTEYVDALGHVNVETVTIDSTCTQVGSEVVKCKDCGTVLESSIIPMKDHVYETTQTVEATCGAAGYVLKTCTECGNQVKEEGAPATGEHTYVTTSESPATCTEMGLKIETCTECGDEHTVVLPKAEHEFSIKNVAATCLEQAHKERVCDVCGYTEKYEMTGELAAHDYETVVDLAPTCVTDGLLVQKCKVCGEENRETVEKTGVHQYGEAGAAVEATCVSGGYVPYTCVYCGAVQKKNETPALGHNYDTASGATLIKEVAATCTTDGYQIVKCARCDVQTVIEGEAATGHEWTEEEVVAAGCLTEGYTVEVCTKCEATRTTNITPAAGHKWQETVVKAATCTEDGQKLYDCSACGAQKTEVVKATGHTWGEDIVIDATCTDPEYTYHTCTVCGAESEKVQTEEALDAENGHAFDQEILVAATCMHTGKAINTCTKCGYTEEVVLDITPHTYHIADAIAAGTVETELKTEYPALYEKYVDMGADYYCTVTAVSCTEMGTIVKKCDYCEVRYQDGAQAALGHNFEVATHAATCYNAGYTVLECTRCGYEAGDRYDEQAQLTHVMTVKSSSSEEPDLKLYAKQTADGITIYTDAECLNELPASELCNVFYIPPVTTAAEGETAAHYVFFCDTCHQDIGKSYVTADTRVDSGYIYTDTAGVKYTVYKVTPKTVEDTTVESKAHVYSTVADETASDALVCETERKEIYYCAVCNQGETEYYNYNKTALVDVEGKLTNPDGHYCDVAYVWHYHELPGVPTEDGYKYWVDANGDGVEDEGEVTYINTTTGEACVDEAEYNYGCRVCGKSLDYQAEPTVPEVSTTRAEVENGAKIDKETIKGTYIETVYNAWLATLTEEQQAIENGKAYVVLTKDMMASAALGHNFVVGEGEGDAKYVVVAYTADGEFVDRTCSEDQQLVVAIKCSRCGMLNYEAAAAGQLGEGESYDIEKADKYANVAHGQIDDGELAKGIFAWLNVSYYAYDENGHWIENATAKTEGAVAVVLNPTEGAKKCDEFTCALCHEVIPQHHYGNVTYQAVGCHQAMDCVYCGHEMEPESHIEPAYTCFSIKNDGYYYCELCGSEPGSPALGKVTPHNVQITVAKDAACETEGAWTITCACEYEGNFNGELITGLANAAEGTVANDMYQAYKEAINGNTTGENTVFNVEWLTIAALGHSTEIWTGDVAPTDEEKVNYAILDTVNSTAPTCTAAGYNKYVCGRCGEAMDEAQAESCGNEAYDLTEELVALGHTTVKLPEDISTIPEDERKNYAYIDEELSREATCTVDGEVIYRCGRCNVLMNKDLAEETETPAYDLTEVLEAQGHDLEVTVSETVFNCVYGYAVESVKCKNCDTFAAVTAEDSEYLVHEVLYQRELLRYFTDHELGAAQFVDGQYDALTNSTNGTLYYEAAEHTYTTFDMQSGEENYQFKAPYIDAEGKLIMGSAYWTCVTCGARNYVRDSVTLEDYFNPDVNTEYAAGAALATIGFSVNGNTELIASLNIAEYFTVKNTGYTLKAEKVGVLADAIIAALTEDAPATFTINTQTVAWNEDPAALKTAVETAIGQLGELKSTTITIAYTVETKEPVEPGV